MDTQIVRINQEHIESEIRKMIAIFCDEIIKQNKTILELRQALEKTDKIRCALARAYAKRLGVLITKKQFEKRFQNDN